MKSFGSLLKNIATNAIKSVNGRIEANAGVRQIENLCAQLGWEIEEYLDDSGLVLHFTDPLVGTRQLLVTAGTSGKTAFLTVFSAAKFALSDLPSNLAFYLLLRNNEGIFHSWQVTQRDDEKVGLSARFCALLDGLNASTFKVICQSLLKEVYEVDTSLRSKGHI